MSSTLIAVPCMDMVAAPFAHSLACLKKQGEVSIAFEIASLIYQSRDTLVKRAVKANLDYIMWFDSDMIFEPDIMERMHKHMAEGKDFVTGLCFRRRYPYTPAIFKTLEFSENGELKSEGFEDYPKDAPFEVAGCGFAACMTSVQMCMDLLLNCQEWFRPIKGLGEDLSFCMRAKELGYKIWCDPSIKVGHVGQMVVNEEFYENTKK